MFKMKNSWEPSSINYFHRFKPVFIAAAVNRQYFLSVRSARSLPATVTLSFTERFLAVIWGDTSWLFLKYIIHFSSTGVVAKTFVMVEAVTLIKYSVDHCYAAALSYCEL